MTAVTLTSECLSVSVHPGHGGVIDSLSFLGGPNLLWTRPGSDLGDLNNNLGEAGEASIATFDHEILAGGWFPMFPTVGPPGSSSDVWMHGEVARIPWTVVASDDHHLAMTVRTRDFEIVREIRLEASEVTVTTSATNRASTPRNIAAGEHPCFRRDLLAGGSIYLNPTSATSSSIADPVAHRLAASTSIDWPIALDTSGRTLDLSEIPRTADGRHDHVSLTLDHGTVRLTSPLLGVSIGLNWDSRVLPFATLWEHFLPVTSAWGGDVLAIEPATTPWRIDSETREHDSLTRVAPRGRLSYAMAVEVTAASRM